MQILFIWNVDMFLLDERLDNDSIVVGDFPLCRLLLKNDKNYPWFILVPRREGVTEIFNLSSEDQQQLLVEMSVFSELLKTLFKADKMNIGALGNMVSQLHIHVIARVKTDATWPQSVWDKLPALSYTNQEIEAVKEQLKSVMPTDFLFK